MDFGLIGRFVPAIDSLRGYTSAMLRRDAIAGITVALIAVPQAMAYAMIFGMPVQYGLYTAIVMGGVAALFCPAKQIINGPTNAISIAMLSALAVVPAEARIAFAIAMALLIGVIQLAITLMRLGDLSRFVSHSVIIGFTLGASLLLAMDQLKNVLGLPAVGDGHDHFLTRFWKALSSGAPLHWPTLAIAAGTIAIALVVRWVNRRWRLAIPEFLTAIVAAALVTWFGNLGANGVKLVDAIPRSLPSFAWPAVDWDLARQMMTSATIIALLGLLEAVAMAKSIAARTGEKFDVNQLCFAEGISNLVGSFFQCFPGSGSLTRSHINYQAGAATQWSAVICAAMVAVILLALAPLAQFIPRPALAAVLILTSVRMVDRESLIYHLRLSRFDRMIVAATAISAVFISVEYCILIGVLLSFMFYLPRAAQVTMNELVVDAQNPMIVRGRLPDDARDPALLIYNFEGELFFGAAPEMESLLEQIEAQVTSETRVVLIRLKYVRNPDAVCVKLIDDFTQRMAARAIQVWFSGIRPVMARCLENSGISQRIGPDRIFHELPEVWSSTLRAITAARGNAR